MTRLSACLLWLCSSAAMAAAPTSGGVAGQTLERGNGPEPSTLDAHRCQEVACGNVLRDLYLMLKWTKRNTGVVAPRGRAANSSVAPTVSRCNCENGMFLSSPSGN